MQLNINKISLNSLLTLKFMHKIPSIHAKFGKPSWTWKGLSVTTSDGFGLFSDMKRSNVCGLCLESRLLSRCLQIGNAEAKMTFFSKEAVKLKNTHQTIHQWSRLVGAFISYIILWSQPIPWKIIHRNSYRGIFSRLLNTRSEESYDYTSQVGSRAISNHCKLWR